MYLNEALVDPGARTRMLDTKDSFISELSQVVGTSNDLLFSPRLSRGEVRIEGTSKLGTLG